MGGSDKEKEDKQSCISSTDFIVNFSPCASDSHSLMHILETCFWECNPQVTPLRTRLVLSSHISVLLRPFLLFCLGHLFAGPLKTKRITSPFVYSTALEISIQNHHFSRMFRRRRHRLIKIKKLGHFFSSACMVLHQYCAELWVLVTPSLLPAFVSYALLWSLIYVVSQLSNYFLIPLDFALCLLFLDFLF